MPALTRRGNALPRFSGEVHDAKGNTIFDGATHFAYSSQNLLTSQTKTAASPSWLANATFGYDIHPNIGSGPRIAGGDLAL